MNFYLIQLDLEKNIKNQPTWKSNASKFSRSKLSIHNSIQAEKTNQLGLESIIKKNFNQFNIYYIL
jgi:hypothetical protein